MNKFGVSRANRQWQAIYPPSHRQKLSTMRSMLLVSTHIPLDRIQVIPIDSKDITVVCLLTEEGPIAIYNIYNNCNHSESLEKLREHLEGTDESNTEGMIWLRNFN